MSKNQTRRQFLRLAGSVGAASLAGAGCRSGQNQKAVQNIQRSRRLFELGLASYTFRKFGLDDTLAMARRLELKHIALKSFHLPLESTKAEIEAVAAKVKVAGLKLYGGGVIYMNNEAEVNRAFNYARAAGMKLIIGVPIPKLLSLVNEKVKEYDIKVAIHNHGPTDKIYPTPAVAYEKIKELDSRVGLCIDIGHTQRASVDPSQPAKRFANRLLDVHMKDVSSAEASGKNVEVGRGVIDIPKFVRTLLSIRYAGIVSFEYEKDPEEPLPGLAESVGYVKGVLACV